MANTYTTYKDSGIPWIGEIPQEWKVLPHKYVMFKIKEIQEHYSGEDIISLTMNGVIVRDLSAGGKIPLTFDGYQKVYKGNLLQCLFDIDVTPRCVGLIKNNGVTSPAYSQFALKDNGYAPYYDYLLRYMDDNKVLLHLSKNLRSSLTETDFGAIQTIIPPISTQISIANFLDEKCTEIDELISLQEKMIDELKAYKQSVITEVVTKGLDRNVKMKDSGVDWIGEIPEHWQIVRPKYVVNINHGTDPKTEGDTPVYGSGANSFRTCGEFKEGDAVLIGRKGATLHIPHYICGRYWNVDTAFDVKSKGDFNLRYYYYLAICFDYKYYMSQTTLPGMTQSNYNNMHIPYPKVQEQKYIVAYLDTKCSEIDSLISIKEKKIEELKDYKKSLIYEYVTGKKRV